MNPDAQLAVAGEWECMECGHIEEGAKTKRPQVCPDCSAPSQALEFFPFGDDDEEDWNEASDELDDGRYETVERDADEDER